MVWQVVLQVVPPQLQLQLQLQLEQLTVAHVVLHELAQLVEHD